MSSLATDLEQANSVTYLYNIEKMVTVTEFLEIYVELYKATSGTEVVNRGCLLSSPIKARSIKLVRATLTIKGLAIFLLLQFLLIL